MPEICQYINLTIYISFCFLSFSVYNSVSMYIMVILAYKPVVQPVNYVNHCGFHFKFYRHFIFHIADRQYQVDSLTGKLFHKMAYTRGICLEILALVGQPLTTSYTYIIYIFRLYISSSYEVLPLTFIFALMRPLPYIPTICFYMSSYCMCFCYCMRFSHEL